jgi:cell division protein FtsZ
LIGIGESTNSNVKEAVKKAVTSPLLDNYDISKAEKALVNVTTNSTATALTLQEIFKDIKSYGIDGHVFFGHTIDNRLDDKVKITIIATGFEDVESEAVTKNKELQRDFFSRRELPQVEETDPSKPAYTYWKPKFLK